MTTYQPDTLVLSSGADKGMAEIGALVYPDKVGMLKGIKTIVGCSVGAIIGYLLAIGYTPEDIMVVGLGVKLFGDSQGSGKLATDYAVCEHSIVIDKLMQLSLARIGKIPTLMEVYQNQGIHLIFPTVNIRTIKPEIKYLDYVNSPTMSALEAIKRSISIQPLFPVVSDDVGDWIDGGVIDPFPINLLDDGYHSILGIHTEIQGGEVANLVEHMNLVISILIDEVKRLHIQQVSSNVKIITVALPNEIPSDNPSQRVQMYYAGYMTGEAFVRDIAKDLSQGIYLETIPEANVSTLKGICLRTSDKEKIKKE